MVMLAVPLLALLATQQADLAAPAPTNCLNVQKVPEAGEYLLPTRFEALIPSNTNVWIREALGREHLYTIVDQTAGLEVAADVSRIGLIDSVLVRITPRIDLVRNHQFTIKNESSTLATFTVNMGFDVVPPSAPDAVVVPASQALQPSCVTSGYEVRAPDGIEPRILIVREGGENVAASTAGNFFVDAPSSLMKSIEVVSVDLAGNYSDTSFRTQVVPDYPKVNATRDGTNAQLNTCACVQAGHGPSLLALGVLGLFLARRRR